MKAMLTVKLEYSDNHKIIQLFKDVAEQLLIKNDGNEGIIKSYENIQLLAPVEAGDYIEIVGELAAFDCTQRKIDIEARKVITHSDEAKGVVGEYLARPVVVCKAKVICEVPKEKQRG